MVRQKMKPSIFCIIVVIIVVITVPPASSTRSSFADLFAESNFDVQTKVKNPKTLGFIGFSQSATVSLRFAFSAGFRCSYIRLLTPILCVWYCFAVVANHLQNLIGKNRSVLLLRRLSMFSLLLLLFVLRPDCCGRAMKIYCFISMVAP